MSKVAFSTSLIKQALNNKINGIIHYGDVSQIEVDEYELMGIKKVIWMHPVNSYVTSLYAFTSLKHYKSQFVIQNLSDKDNQFAKRFDTYCNTNIVYLNMDNYDVIKLNNIAGQLVDYKAIITGFGEITNKYPGIKAIIVTEDSVEIKDLLKQLKFVKGFISNKSTLYVREQ